MDIGYTTGKIGSALFELALNPGDLHARVPKACAVLLCASYRVGYESEFGRIEDIMGKVVRGDWSRVSDAEIQEIAGLIWALHERAMFGHGS